MSNKGSILVVDDDSLLCESIRVRLEQDGYTVGVAATGNAAIDAAKRQPPDVVVLDIGLPDSDGLDICRALQRYHQMPVIFLTGRSSEIDKVSGLSLGDDYVTKPFSMVELEARLSVAFRHLRQMIQPAQPQAIDAGGIRLNLESHQVTIHDKPIDLTPKEFDLLHLLMSHPGKALTNNEILSSVWGAEYTGAFELVYVHVSWLRQKLAVDPRTPHYIQTIRGVGYRFAPEEP